MSPADAVHEPVMLERVVELLANPGPQPAVLVDATVGAAGHAAALLAASGEATHLVAFDRDPEALAMAGRRLAAYGDRVHLVHAGYDQLRDHLTPVAERVGPVQAVLYDLGVSSMQLDRPERGFSFRAEASLDMRMDPSGPTAADLVNSAEPGVLAAIIRRYGEERHASRIARAIERARPLATTTELAEVVAAAVPAGARHGRVHPATRTFQALRIAVNDELDRLSASLPQALELAATPAASAAPAEAEHTPRGGRVAVLTYHSLEDRITKQVLSDAATGCICPPDLPVCGCGRVPLVRWLLRGGQRPTAEETARNRRARSARLRAIEKLVDPE